jgi:bisphosphoglycerate-independent phosphoglycerate mutase (AlkP superfamily)
LRDVAPTLLGILGMPVPQEMTGHDLRLKKGA